MGDSYATWSAGKRPKDKLWLRDFFPQQLESPPKATRAGADDTTRARIVTWGYDAGLFTQAGRQRSFVFAENLLSALDGSRLGAPVSERVEEILITR